MVKIYPMAEFNADFPDDSEEEDGDIVVFPGRNVATEIAELFERAGYKCEGPLSVSVHWGYHVNVLGRPSMFFAVHTFEDGEYYLYTKDDSSLDRLLPSSKRKYREFLRKLGHLLDSDARFRNVRWFSLKDPNHEHPVEAPVEGD
jgi:hypothetical protein